MYIKILVDDTHIINTSINNDNNDDSFFSYYMMYVVYSICNSRAVYVVDLTNNNNDIDSTSNTTKL